jgi:hypothetical protein
MATFTIHQAKKNLSRLIRKVAAGEEVIIGACDFFGLFRQFLTASHLNSASDFSKTQLSHGLLREEQSLWRGWWPSEMGKASVYRDR